MIAPADAGASMGLAGTDRVDGYVAADRLEQLEEAFMLVDDPRGTVTLRVLTLDDERIVDLVASSRIVAALGLAESLDVREQGAGHEVLRQALAAAR